MKKFLTVVLAIVMTAALCLVGCKKDGKTVPPESVTITNTQTTLAAGEYTLTAEVKPDNASQAVTWSLIGNPLGITLDGNKLTVATTSPNETQVKVKVAVQTDPTISDTKTFTVDNPPAPAIEISTEAELKAMELDKNYKLVNDITLTDIWEPLGELESPDDGIAGVGLSGTLDGNGYSIKNISFVLGTNDNRGYNKGFFYKVEATGVIKNLGFESLKEEGEGVTGLGSWNGVITAHNHGTIQNCYTDVQVAEAIAPFGTFVAENSAGGKIENCYSIGVADVENSGANTSGFVTVNAGTITQSFVLDTSVKAAVGLNGTQNADIQKSESWMKIAQNYKDAGWSEDIWNLVEGNYPQLKHTDNTALTPKTVLMVTNTESYLDYNDEAQRELQITYYLSEMATDKTVTFALKAPVTGVSISNDGKVTLTEAVEDGATFTVTVTSSEVTAPAEKTFTVSRVNVEAVVDISDFDDLLELVNAENQSVAFTLNYRLTKDIDVTNWYNTSIAPAVYDEPTDTLAAVVPFTGTFDGNGYTIKGLRGGDGAANFGLFGEIGEGGVVKNLGIEIHQYNMTVGTGSAVIASVNNGTIENVKITALTGPGWNNGPEATGAVNGGHARVAGIVCNNFGTIKNCIYTVEINVNDVKATVGGIAYTNHTGGTIENCFVDTTVTGITQALGEADATLDAACIKTTEELKDTSLYGAFDATIWNITSGSVPTLKNGCTAAPSGD